MNLYLIRQGVWVNTDLDRVVLTVGKTDFPMPYVQAFKIAAAVRLGCRRLMQYCGERHTNWYERARLDYYAPVPELSDKVRSTRTQKYDWRIDIVPHSEVLQLYLDNMPVEFHFEAGLKLSEWLRDAGRRAKRWAGDETTHKHGMATLTDAEHNYKYGLNKIL